MKANFSEFSYGFSFTENLMKNSTVRPGAAPVFLCPFDEKKFGYDVKIDLAGVPVFFQFKRSERMIRDNAREIKHNYLSRSYAPYYRISLHKDNSYGQHLNLINLESKNPGLVYYVAPEFHRRRKLNKFFLGSNVPKRSAWFSPNNIGHLSGNAIHTVCFKPNKKYAYLCSEPKRVKKHSYNEVIELINKKLDNEKTPKAFLERTLPDTKQIFSGTLTKSKVFDSEREFNNYYEKALSSFRSVDDDDESTLEVYKLMPHIQVLRSIARKYFESELFFAQPRVEKQ